MRTIIFSFTLISLALFSCRKPNLSESCTTNTPTINEFTPMAIGNSWVYQKFEIDPETNSEIAYDSYDSLYINRDTIINGETYFVLEKTFLSQNIETYLRYENNYLVDNYGKKWLSAFEGTDTVSVEPNSSLVIDSVYTVLSSDVVALDLPIGTLESSRQRKKILFLTPQYIPEGLPVTRTNDFYYSKGIGLLEYTYGYTSTNNYFEMRLASYHLE